MGWFSKRRPDDPLAGKWVIDATDAKAVAEFGQVELEFDDSRLRYEVVLPDKRQVILMTYRVEGDVLVTDQPSQPRSERTLFSLGGDTLTLTFGGISSRFIRR